MYCNLLSVKTINININFYDTMKNLKENTLISILTNLYYSDAVASKRPADKYIELDLGCGKGTYSLALAQKYPERFVFSADLMIGRLRKLDSRILSLGLSNMALFKVEARHFVSCFIEDCSLDRIHILCPDPWPKHKHKGNRLLCSEFIGQLYRVLKHDGVFHFSTDDTNYFETVTGLVQHTGIFLRDDDAISDVAGIKTDFEKRWNSMGKDVNHIAWRKLEMKHIPR